MEEFFYISHDLTEQDRGGRVVLSYKLMMEAEHRFRIKRGGGVGHCCPLSSSGSAPLCSQEMLERIAWSKPDSKTLERLVWWVYDGLLSPGLTPKLMGPKSYNQVTRCLAAKVFRGLQVCCPARTSAQFDKPPPVKVRSVIFVPPPSEIVRKTEAMDTASQKVESAEEGAVGGEVDIDPDRHPMAWMRNHQRCYDDEMISFWLLLRPLTDGRGTATRRLACCLLSTWQWSSVMHPMSCPSRPNQHGDRVMAASGSRGPRGKQGRSMDRGLCLLLTTCGRSIIWMVLGNKGQRNGPIGQPSGTGIPVRHGKACKPVHSVGVLATEA